MLVGAPLLVFVVPALAGYPLLTGDAVIQNLPLRALAGGDLRHGHLPLYDPFVWSGAPLLGGINAGAAFPAVALFAVLPALPAYVATQVLAFAGTATGSYALFRSRALGPLAAALGAASFGLSGFVVAQAVHLDVVETAACLAWLLFALDRIANGRVAARPGYTALAAAATGGIGLAGSPEAAFYSAVGAALFAGHLLLHARERRAVAGWLGLAALLGAALAGIQVTTGADFVSASQRAAVSHAFLTAGSLDGGELLTLLAPHVLGGGPVGLRPYVGSYNLAEIDAYPGILALAAAGALLWRWRDADAWRWRIWYLVGGVGLLVALGRVTPLPHVLAHVPVVGQSRLPSRALLLFALAAAALLGHWVDGLAGGRGATVRVRRARVAGALAPAAVLGFLAVVAVGGPTVARRLAGGPVGPWSLGAVAPYLALAALLAAATAALALGAHRLGAPARHRLVLAIALLDLLLSTVDQSSLAPVYASALAQPNPASRALEASAGTGRFVIVDPARTGGIALDELGAPDLNVMGAAPSAQGYGSLVWGPYAGATGTHGQDVASPAAFAGTTFDTLDVTVLLAGAGAFVVPVGATVPLIALRSGTPSTRYFGAVERVTSVTLAPIGREDLRSVAAGIRLLRARGSPSGERPRIGRAGGAVVASFTPPMEAAGLVLPAGRGAGNQLVAVAVHTAARRSFSPTGPLAATVTPPHWQLDGSLGPYARFRNTRAAGPLHAVLRSGAERPTLDPHGSTDAASLLVGVDAPSPFLLVRSATDLPGSHATLVERGRSRALAVQRDGLVEAVELPQGRYAVRFTYAPPGLDPGLAASAAGAAGIAALAALALRRRTRWRPGQVANARAQARAPGRPGWAG